MKNRTKVISNSFLGIATAFFAIIAPTYYLQVGFIILTIACFFMASFWMGCALRKERQKKQETWERLHA